MNNPSRAVFLDLHGTLGDQGDYGIDGFECYPSAIEAVVKLHQAGLLTIIITNQSRIARGQFSEKRFEDFAAGLQSQVHAQGGRLDAVYYCPHTAEQGCDCRKPKAGLLLRAKSDFNISLDASYLVGDVGAWDMVAAASVGCAAVLVRTGWGEASLTEYRDLWSEVEPDYIAADIEDAAGRVLKDMSSPSN